MSDHWDPDHMDPREAELVLGPGRATLADWRRAYRRELGGDRRAILNRQLVKLTSRQDPEEPDRVLALRRLRTSSPPCPPGQ